MAVAAYSVFAVAETGRRPVRGSTHLPTAADGGRSKHRVPEILRRREHSNLPFAPPTWAPQRNDKRFNDPAWTENSFYKGMLQGYMAWSQSLQNFAEKAGFEAKEAGRAKFLLSQISEALAPTNFLFSNPAAIKAANAHGKPRA